MKHKLTTPDEIELVRELESSPDFKDDGDFVCEKIYAHGQYFLTIERDCQYKETTIILYRRYGLMKGKFVWRSWRAVGDDSTIRIATEVQDHTSMPLTDEMLETITKHLFIGALKL